jgi:NADPH-dependent 2,4-dienoyl-CoA reductase/sulfur reductase-like enzyme
LALRPSASPSATRRPNDWLEGSGLHLDNGVICDATLTAAEHVWAAGDVARWQHPRYGEPIRVEHWTSAVEQANAVAAGIMGHPQPYESVPYVWSDQLGGRLQIFGRIEPGDEIHYVHGGPGEKSFVALAGRDGQLAAVVGFAALKQLLPYRKKLTDRATMIEALSA